MSSGSVRFAQNFAQDGENASRRDMARPHGSLNIMVTLGAEALLGAGATERDIAETLRPLPRDEVIRHCTRMLNTLAFDRRLQDEQEDVIRWLPPDAAVRYAQQRRFMDAEVRIFHPFQQLVLVHSAARFCEGSGDLPREEQLRRWAVASIQINDVMVRNVIPERLTSPEKALFLFCEEAARWELIHPSNPNRSVARLRALVTTDVPRAGVEEGRAAASIRERFAERLGIAFDVGFNLTALLIYWWQLQSTARPGYPDASTFELGKWLPESSSISIADQETYLSRVSMAADEIVPAFDAFGGPSLHELLPFRRRPILRNDPKRFAFLCPQFAVEKGGIDLLWLTSHDPGGPREERPWTDDFGILYERYVRMILEGVGDRLGGTFLPDVSWTDGAGGQVDGLIHAGRTLIVIETKASLLNSHLLAIGNVEDVRRDIERKFIGSTRERKGAIQLLRAVEWLEAQRRLHRPVRGIDLSRISRVIPILIVADRALRFPAVSLWLDHRMKELKSELRIKSPGRLERLVVCGTDDLEDLEHSMLEGGRSFVDVLLAYSNRVERGSDALWQHFEPPTGPNPRLDRMMDEWFEELRRDRVLPP